ncbi:Ger(x)C family spore germination protein [Bacillus paranthracis]|uniref:Ger(X)C family spore germination protein n=1 Tax=Bacillus paranthracis TaxID=2026186 RepID=A0AAJ1K6M2_9BACI|nr:Ger(x)C family spore germination protein [Bacillus paranthracis]MDG0949890.1 Ger(x)C family spore germination protein [Bacillus paranthracis]MDG0955687.1 Ger(x)C family spore germination protein [Bacillus paranthracis]
MILKIIQFIVLIIFLSGCIRPTPIEKISLVLLIALDQNNDREMLVGASVPLFKKAKQGHSLEHLVRAATVYEGFSKINARMKGHLTASKAEIVLIGKKLVQKGGWIKEFDFAFRDPYNTTNTQVLLVEGDVEELLKWNPPDHTLISSYIKGIMDSSVRNNQPYFSTLQRLITRQNLKGIAQIIPVIKKEKNGIAIKEIAFLNSEGKLVAKLPEKDLEFFNIINNFKDTERMMVHLPLGLRKGSQKFDTSVLIQDIKRKIHVDYQNGKWKYTINLRMNIAFTERTNGQVVKHSKKQKAEIQKLERKIQSNFNRKIQSMIVTLHKKQIDPLNLSTYAKAYQYQNWRKNQARWPHEISNSIVNIKTQIKINNVGAIRKG